MTIEEEVAGIEAAIRNSSGSGDVESLREAKEALDAAAGRAGQDKKLLARCAELYIALTERFEGESHLLALAEAASLEAVDLGRKAGDAALVTRAAVQRGEHLLLVGERREALECLVDAAERLDRPDLPSAWMSRLWRAIGQAWFGIDRFEDLARRSFERAAEVAMASGTAHVEPLVMLGACDFLLGEFQRSKELLGRAAARAKTEPTGPETLARIHWWQGLCALRSGSRVEADVHHEAIRRIAEGEGGQRASMMAASLDGLLQIYFGDVTSGVAGLVAVQQRINSLWPPMREPLLALRDAAELKDSEQVRKAYLEHLDAEAKRDAALQKFARGDVGRLSDELISLLEAQGEVLADKAEREAAEVINVLLDNATIAELREDASGEHPYRVGALAAQLARRIGKDGAFCKTIQVAAALHDLGKAGLPDSLVTKKGRLEPHQREAMQEHAETGWRLLSEQKLEHPVLAMGARIARHHHEHWDGNGYPAGLIGEEIPLEARLTSLAEVFDALTHKRSWRAARSVDNALRVIESLRGYQFDPSLTEQFAALVRELVQEHGSGLDAYLGKKAQRSALLATRRALLERARDGTDDEDRLSAPA